MMLSRHSQNEKIEPATPRPAPSVLVIDDDNSQYALIERALGPKYSFHFANGSSAARALMEERVFDLILCDVEMPGESGMQLLQSLPASQEDAAVIMVTALDDLHAAELVFLIGAYGYIVKPYRAIELQISARNAIRRRGLEIQNRERENDLAERLVDQSLRLNTLMSELEGSRIETLDRLSLAVEARDSVTAEHVEGMTVMVERLAIRVGFDVMEAKALGAASMLHDVGKIGVPDTILMKPGPLTDNERAIMETHAEIGHKMLDGSDNPLLQLGAEVALTHHERIDGNGYPRKLAGDAIPRSARVVQIVDVYSALANDRPYRPAMSVDESLEVIGSGLGKQFDAEYCQVFLDNFDSIATG